MRWFCSILLASVASAQAVPASPAFPAKPFDLCSVNEGKEVTYADGPPPVAFSDLQRVDRWTQWASGGFEIRNDISRRPQASQRVAATDLGRLAQRRVRRLDLHLGEDVIASMLVAETADGRWAPVLRWYGKMPPATLVNAMGRSLLWLQKDWGGTVRMVETWAWAEGHGGLLRVDTGAAVAEAMGKVPGTRHGDSLGPALWEWTPQTGVWKGAWNVRDGKGRFAVKAQARFRWDGQDLRVEQAERRESSLESTEESEVVVRWPRANR
jgi:hypothetical protein